MSFIRPELRAQLIRWREVLAGVALDAVGLVLIMGPGRGRLVVGALLLLLGSLLVLWGVQRARFRNEGGGAGMVEIDERRIAYFGPFAGGALALEEIDRIVAVPPRAWELTDRSGQRLTIPADAEGADALFEAFTALPGFSVARLASAARNPPLRRTTIWTRAHDPRG